MTVTDTAIPPGTGAERKADHLRIAAGPGVEHRSGTGLEGLRLRHRALPERALAAVGLGTTMLGARLAAPLVISAMTGGTPESAAINRRLTLAAAEHGIALVLGSGRRLLDGEEDDPDLLRTYRPEAGERPPLLLANLGAAQIRGSGGAERAERLVDLLDADGLSIHLNPLQEAVQPEGEPDFTGVLDGIAAAFADWGVPTAVALTEARALVPPGFCVVASGGLRDGVDAAKCLALGATAVGMARPFLVAAQADRAGEAVGTVIEQLRVATWAAGAGATAELGGEHLR